MIDDVILGTEEEIMAGLAELSAEVAPRRFTVCVISREEDDAAIIGWGLEFDDEVCVYLPAGDCPDAGTGFLRLTSIERFRRRLASRADVRVVWVDPA